MAQVTVELRKLLQTDFKLFDFPYEIDDAAWKEKLERDIINHYYFHEIGSETPDRFKHQFMSKMLEIMPYYNKLHQTIGMQLTEFMKTTSMKETYLEETEGLSTSNTDNNINTTTDNKQSEYPQTGVVSSDILSAASWDTGSTTDIGNMIGSSTSNRNFERMLEGYQGLDKMELLEKYRSSLLRLNTRIIQELKPLFILIY